MSYFTALEDGHRLAKLSHVEVIKEFTIVHNPDTHFGERQHIEGGKGCDHGVLRLEDKHYVLPLAVVEKGPNTFPRLKVEKRKPYR